MSSSAQSPDPTPAVPAALSSRPPGRRRSPEKHDAILDAAAAIAWEQGYDRAAIEAVAARAGVGKTTIYRRWPNKAALFVAVYARLVPPERLEKDTGGLVGDLRHLFSALFTFYRDTPAAVVLSGLIADAQHDAEAKAALEHGLVGGRRGLLAGIFLKAAARGEWNPAFSPERANDLCVAMIWHRLLTDPSGLDEPFADTVIGTVVALGGRP